MPLRGKKPEAVEKRLKAMIFGVAGVGKTTAAIQFPKPYLIDTEKGAENEQYVDALDRSGGAIFQTSDFDEMLQEVITLLSEEHPYQTLVIDPVTTVWNDLVEKAEEKVGTKFGRHFGEANKRMKHLFNLLLRLDMNVLITAHSKTVYGEELTKLGETFDAYKKLDYLFDLVFEVQKRGTERVGIVQKTRVNGFPEGAVFPFSYDEIASRYGREILERDAVPQTLATAEQVAELAHLVDAIKVEDTVVQKWLDKAGAASFGEMSEDQVCKCIEFLRAKIAKAS